MILLLIPFFLQYTKHPNEKNWFHQGVLTISKTVVLLQIGANILYFSYNEEAKIHDKRPFINRLEYH